MFLRPNPKLAIVDIASVALQDDAWSGASKINLLIERYAQAVLHRCVLNAGRPERADQRALGRFEMTRS